MHNHTLHTLRDDCILTMKKIYIISASLVRDSVQPIKEEIKRLKRRK